MVTLLDRSETGVNVVSIGVTSGLSTSQVATANTALLNEYASQGYSLYFPPGEYYIDGRVRWTSNTNVKLWGDAARIYMQSDVQRMFQFDDCDKVEVCGLTLHTAYYLDRTSGEGASTTSPLVADNCKVVRLHHNVIEGFQCHAMRINGGSDISVQDNTFLDGHWVFQGSPQQRDTACIKFWIDPGNSNARPRDVVITGNQCNTKALIAISAQHATQKTIVANNSCIARETDGTLITTYVNDAPKAGIEMQYFADASGTYVGADNDDFDQLIITGNNVSGCRFSGITGQSSERPNAVHAGGRAIVSNNTVRYCGLSNENNTSNLTGGINWIGYRDLIVSHNIIKNIPNVQQQPNGSNALTIQGIWALSDGSTNTGTPSSCVVQGNIITDCDARGIYITSQSSQSASLNSGDIIVSDNIVQDIKNNDFIRVIVPPGTYRAGHIHITGNKCASTKTVGLYGVRVEVGTIEPAECLISNNTFNFRDATFSTTTRPILETLVTKAVITGNRIIGNAAGIGLNLRTLEVGQRFDQLIIGDNSIDNCEIGVGSSNAPTYGPFLIHNTTLTNCNTPIQNPRSVKHGFWANGKAIMFDDVDPTIGGTAPEGTYLAGDSIQNTLANSTNDVTGWFSTGSGGWVPGVQIP